MPAAGIGSTVCAMPDTLTTLQWRPLQPEDVPAWAELLAAAELVDKTGENESADDLAEQIEDESLNLASDSWAVLDDGQLIAYGAVHGATRVWDVDTVYCFGTVHPSHRGRGIGRRLLNEQLQRAEALHAQRHPRHPAQITVPWYDHIPSAVALVKAAGLRPLRHFFDMERDLRSEAPAPQDPAAPLRVVPFTFDRDEEVRRAHNAAFRDHFGSTERDVASWKQWFTGTRNFRSELSYLVLDGDAQDAAVAGYLLGYFYDADAAVDDYRTAYIGQLGTLPQWRGRGVASALLTHALAAYRTAGYEQAGLDVDSANGTGALGLYERVGFTVVRSSTSWVREIAAQQTG